MTDTLTGPGRHEEDIERSRFLALADGVADVPSAMAFLRRHQHPGASHHCWAYRIGDLYRFNDDGEPGGTAGRPILQAIDGQGCDRVVVLVVRWFGGIKLGTGGLARAYAGVAAQCLRQAPRRPLVPTRTLRCACSYAQMERVRGRLLQSPVLIEAETFDADGVVWTLVVPVMGLEAFRAAFADLTHGQGLLSESP